MNINILSIDGSIKETVDLPDIFNEPYRPDLIKKAVLSLQSRRYQPHGVKPYAGYDTSAESWGVGRGVSRIPRIKNGRRAARSPGAVGGRRAHPPKVDKIFEEKMNKKEMKKALKSAIAATANIDLVVSRGHRIGDLALPLVIERKIEEIDKTKHLEDVLKKIGVYTDIERAKDIKIRSGRGKMRGRRYKGKKSILFVVKEDKGLGYAARNLVGADFSTVNGLNVELLAPGTDAGRLVVWSEAAISSLKERSW
ncbi:50S ribosomal protein L4 [Candidatus Methanoliparum sp. LAM-1]|uniref:50S ribosomal protein L4 n=1 Tax=Candidatus Methanoliparum sp. LAM-1 TaxID=2874846 RepID=UPI003B641D02